MKNLKELSFIVLILAFASCANVSKFPVSTVTPAANIEVHRQQDQNGNNKITITANYLAAAERLHPPKKVYVAWVLFENNGVRNLGQLKIKNAKTAEIRAVIPFKYTEIFITAEDQVDILHPAGVEISRIKF